MNPPSLKIFKQKPKTPKNKLPHNLTKLDTTFNFFPISNFSNSTKILSTNLLQYQFH